MVPRISRRDARKLAVLLLQKIYWSSTIIEHPKTKNTVCQEPSPILKRSVNLKNPEDPVAENCLYNQEN